MTIHTPPGEWHWHGATPTNFVTHLAMWESPEVGPESAWGDHVTDLEYRAILNHLESLEETHLGEAALDDFRESGEESIPLEDVEWRE